MVVLFLMSRRLWRLYLVSDVNVELRTHGRKHKVHEHTPEHTLLGTKLRERGAAASVRAAIFILYFCTIDYIYIYFFYFCYNLESKWEVA